MSIKSLSGRIWKLPVLLIYVQVPAGLIENTGKTMPPAERIIDVKYLEENHIPDYEWNKPKLSSRRLLVIMSVIIFYVRDMWIESHLA